MCGFECNVHITDWYVMLCATAEMDLQGQQTVSQNAALMAEFASIKPFGQTAVPTAVKVEMPTPAVHGFTGYIFPHNHTCFDDSHSAHNSGQLCDVWCAGSV